MSLIASNIQRIRETIARLQPDHAVEIMAVTKNRTRYEAEEAINLGVDLIGENRVQESIAKWTPRPLIPLHLIGHLQTNKVKYAIDHFDAVDSLDSEKVAEQLNRRLAEQTGGTFNVMLQINAGMEESKTGFPPDCDVVRNFLLQASKWPHLEFIGIMALFPRAIDTSEQEKQRIRKLMKETGELWRMCQMEGFPWAPLTILSMGMSEDYEWAIDAGSTLIRLGTNIFGPR